MTACPPAQTTYMQTTRTRIPVPPRAAPGLVSELGRARPLAGCEWIVGFIARTLPTILCAAQPSPGEGRLRRRRTDARLALVRAGLCRAVLSVLCGTFQATNAADFKAELFGEPGRIFAHLMAQDMNTGAVRINGVAMDLAAQPVWDFGDGTVVGSWFPAEHTYPSTASNYVVKVTGFFSDGASNSTELLVRFAPPAIAAVTLAEDLRVTVPADDVSLVSRMPGFGFSPSLGHFDDSFFSPSLPRDAVEYVLTVAATVQWDLINSNVFLVDDRFQQAVLRDPDAGGMYSIWYSSPVAFGSGDYGFQGTPQYSSFFHEMGHNFTLNFPAACLYGETIGGHANAIYSETLAQIFQHATAYEIMNHPAEYGLPPDLVFDIRQSARSSIGLVRAAYERYLGSGTAFFSWNDPATPDDETFDTFMTIAYEFFAHAEKAGRGYAAPARRLMRLLGVFNEDLSQRYEPQSNSPAADAFRATLLVTALSYAFESDLRAEFRELGFPIDDAVYDELMSLGPADAPSLAIALDAQHSTVTVSWPASAMGWLLQENTNALSPASWSHVTDEIHDDGSTKTLLVGPPAGSRFYRLILDRLNLRLAPGDLRAADSTPCP